MKWILILLTSLGWSLAAFAGEPPIAQDDEAATDDQTPVLIDVQANDVDPDGSALTLTLGTDDCPGDVVNYQDGTLAFYPTTTVQATTLCEIHYSVGDGVASDTAKAVLTIEPSDGTPTPCSAALAADSESFLVTPGEVFSIQRSLLLEGDDPAGEITLDFDPASLPTLGTLTPAASAFVYAPGAGFDQPDSFQYRIRCASDPSDTALGTVHLVPNQGGTPPVATPNSFLMAQQEIQGGPAELQVFFHQLLADDQAANGGELRFKESTPVSDGTLRETIVSLDYRPPVVFSDTATTSYRIEEAGNPVLSNFAEVSFEVYPAPQGQGDQLATPYETPRTIQAATELLGNDNGFGLALHVEEGSLTDPSDGTVVEQAPGVLVYTPRAGFFGADTFTYRAANQLAGVNDDWVTSSVPITVEVEVAAPPVDAVDDHALVPTGETVHRIATAGLLANDQGVGELVVLSVGPASLGTTQLTPDGVVYTPSADFWTIGRDQFTYAVQYAQGGSLPADTATVYLQAQPPCTHLFSDDFTGGLNRWTQLAAVGGDLAVSAEAGIVSGLGLSVEVLPAATYVFVGDGATEAGTDLSVTFWLNDSQLQLADGAFHFLMRSGQAFGLVLTREEGQTQITLAARADDGHWHHSPWAPLPSGDRHLRTDWLAASGPGASDGVARLWVDGLLTAEHAGLDNDSQEAGALNLGAVFPIAPTTQGSLFFDDYRSCQGPESRHAFARDDFEGSDFSAWTGAVQAAGVLNLSTGAALEGAQGLEVDITSSDPAGAFLYDDSLDRETHYWATFRLDANDLVMADGDSFLLFGGAGPGGWVVSVRLAQIGGQKLMRVVALEDDLGWVGSVIEPLPSGIVDLSLEWWASSGPGKNNGGARLKAGEQGIGSLRNLDNDSLHLTRGSIGAVAGLDAGTGGSFAVDAFKSWRGLRGRERFLRDDFETGDLSAWTTAFGPVSASSTAALAGSYGLEVDLTDAATAGALVSIDLGGVQRSLRARMELDPNSLVMAPGPAQVFLSATGTNGAPFLVRLREEAGIYQLGVLTWSDDGTMVPLLPWLPLSDGPQTIYLEWLAATFPGASDGVFEISLEGGGKLRRDDLDTDGKTITGLSLGAPWGVSPQTTGRFFIDNFEAWR
ncbi:MAG: cadherin-like domain-containing protein [Deltaproteobacteria bacterium]|nr:cadherin-like domain-containing protein [Deltaproteobacteria bacterium]